jgi:hypothetical protein
MSFKKAVSDYSKQKITENNRVYLPKVIKEMGFKAGEEVEISFDPDNKTVKLALLEQ